MSALGTSGPRGEPDGSRAPGPSQALGFSRIAGLLALLAWCALTLASGGVDIGIPGAGDGGAEWSVAASLAGGAALAALVVWRTREAALWRSTSFLLAGGASAVLALWAALSIAWSPAPHLAWIEANFLALYLIALILAAGLAHPTRRAPQLLVSGLALAALPALIWALAGETLPTVAGAEFEPGRLSGPMDSPNALATVVALALPGVVWFAGSGRARVRAPLGAGWVALLLIALGLTLSRSGIAAAAIAAGIALLAPPATARAARALAFGAAGAVAPLAYGLSAEVLTADRVAADLREAAGLRLGALIVAGVLGAGLLALVWERFGRTRRPAAIATVVLAVALLAPAGAGASTDVPARDAIGNDPDRVLSISSNNRLDWWGEAVAGWRARPLAGNGAGSFGLVHLRERSDGDPRFNVRQPHQVALKMLSDLGAIGLVLLLGVAAGVASSIAVIRRTGPRYRWALPLAPIAAVAVEAQVDVSLSVPALAVPAFAAAGVLLAEAARGGRARDTTGTDPVLAGASVLLVLVPCGLGAAARAVRRTGPAGRGGGGARRQLGRTRPRGAGPCAQPDRDRSARAGGVGSRDPRRLRRDARRVAPGHGDPAREPEELAPARAGAGPPGSGAGGPGRMGARFRPRPAGCAGAGGARSGRGVSG